MFTALDTVRVLLEVLEEITITVSTIDKARSIMLLTIRRSPAGCAAHA